MYNHFNDLQPILATQKTNALCTLLKNLISLYEEYIFRHETLERFVPFT